MILDRQNRIWAANNISYNYQIYMFDPQTQIWLLQSGSQKFGTGAGGGWISLQFDNQDRLWVATDYGVNVYDGTSWFTYNYDLYSNEVYGIQVFGNGPALPDLSDRAPGSVHGRLVNPASSVFTDAQVEICIKPPAILVLPPGTSRFIQGTPCADQAYHALATVDANGNFVLTDIPAGRYYLMFKVGFRWYILEDSRSMYSKPFYFEIRVDPGTETQLGDIYTPEP